MKTRFLLNRINWDPQLKDQQEDFTITFIHRGAPNDEKTIQFIQIKKVLASWFIYTDEDGQEYQIPFHRIITIKNTKRNSCLYIKKNHFEEEKLHEEAPQGTIPE